MENECKVEECVGKVVARGICNKHYHRWRKFGDPTAGADAFRDPMAALESRTRWSGECLLWTGAKDSDGYGNIKVEGAAWSVHRLVWTMERGTIPAGAKINHRCWEPACCRIDHLEIATHAQNLSYRKGPQSNSHTGVRNVTATKGGKFVVRVRSNGELRHYGTFDDLDEAADVAATVRDSLFGRHAGGR